MFEVNFVFYVLCRIYTFQLNQDSSERTWNYLNQCNLFFIYDTTISKTQIFLWWLQQSQIVWILSEVWVSFDRATTAAVVFVRFNFEGFEYVHSEFPAQ